VSEDNSLPIWLPAVIRDLASADPGIIEITGRELTHEVDFIEFSGDENGIVGKISRTQHGWAGPVGVSLQRIDAIWTTGQVLTFHARVSPNGESTEQQAGTATTATIEVRGPEG